ncbi:MAG: hypothetical protein ABJZ18_04095 [Algibacter sp.]
MIKLIRLFAILWTAIAFGQENKVKAAISSVNHDGLYRIPIHNNIRSYATPNFRDFRIWDSKGEQVPYYVQRATADTNTKVSDFIAFPIVSRTVKIDTSATVIFKNPHKTIDQAGLLIANYQGEKRYKLEGSNDQNQWFGIVNNGQLSHLSHATETRVYKVITFPLCAYRYLKIVFDDRHSLPINLLKVGKGNTETITITPITMEDIPVKTTAFSEKGKTSQIHVSFERPEVINQIRIAITGPNFYNRKATLYTIQEREVKHKIESYKRVLTTFSIRSDNPLIFDISTCIEKEIYLDIDNEDNPKLEISGIHFMQESIHLVAYLKADDTYKLTAGNDKLSLPNYDISSAINTIKGALPIAKLGAIVYVQSEKTERTRISFWQQPWFMWCCIGFAALVILYYTFNLLKDLNRSKD